MKVVLVHPNYRRGVATGGYVFTANPPLGLCYIAGLLREHYIDVEIIDANAFDMTPAQVAEKCKGADIVGVSMLSPGYSYGVELVKLLPKEVLKVAGNAHATGYYMQVLNSGFDVVAIGEGEFTMLELAEKKPMKDIKGIAYKEDGEVIITLPRDPTDPNTLPFPARDLLVNNGMDKPYLSFMTEKTPFAPLFTSRGCPYDCQYCCKKIFGYKFRPVDPGRVLAEIIELVDRYHVKEIDIADDCFNFDIDRAKEICDLIIESKVKVLFRCTNGIRADKVDEELLRKMKKAGWNYIAYGVESGNADVLAKIPKGEKLEDIERAFKLTRKVGIKTTAFIIFGLQGDTKESMQDTIDFTKKLKPNYVSVSIMTPYPGTKLYDKISRDGKFIIPKDWIEFSHTNPKMTFTHPDFPDPELTQEMWQKCWNEFYLNPGFMIRNVLSIRSMRDLKKSWSGFTAILKMVKK